MQRKFIITNVELKEIKALKGKEKNVKIYKRLSALELQAYGAKCKDVAGMLGVCIDTISDWNNLFLSGGVKAVCNLNYKGRRISKLEKHKDVLKEYVENKVVPTLSEMKEWLKEKHNVEVEESWLYRFCKKNSIFLTKRQDLSPVNIHR